MNAKTKTNSQERKRQMEMCCTVTSASLLVEKKHARLFTVWTVETNVAKEKWRKWVAKIDEECDNAAELLGTEIDENNNGSIDVTIMASNSKCLCDCTRSLF